MLSGDRAAAMSAMRRRRSAKMAKLDVIAFITLFLSRQVDPVSEYEQNRGIKYYFGVILDVFSNNLYF